jgi:UDP-glucose 6-dehydrogenase
MPASWEQIVDDEHDCITFKSVRAYLKRMLSISIVGTGYVGLSTAVCFASRGYHVIAATQDTEKAQGINAKRAPFYEPGLNQLLEKGIELGTLEAVDARDEAVTQTDATFITVGTPEQADGRIDLRFLGAPVYRKMQKLCASLQSSAVIRPRCCAQPSQQTTRKHVTWLNARFRS